MSRELHFLGAAEAGRLIQARKLSPVELVDAFLRRIDAVDATVHSYITVLADQATAAARAAEAEIVSGGWRGPLHGLPYGLKDNFYTKGIRTTAGSRVTQDDVPSRDAAVHSRLAAGGAILLGKLSTYEFGTGTGEGLFELPFPPARNPWNTACFTGGSSTGVGAAVAAGTAMFGLGTDTGGSVRLPAQACGVVGLKPTYGLVSRAGILPNCFSLDHVGPLAWTVEDAALALQAIVGSDPDDPASATVVVGDYARDLHTGISGLRIGVVRRFHERDVAADPAIGKAFDAALAVLTDLGARLIELDPSVSLQDFRNCMRILNTAESYTIHEQDFLERRAEMGAPLRDKLIAGACVSAADYLRAQRWRRHLAYLVDGWFAGCDAVVCCGATRRAPRFDDCAGIVAFTTESAMAVFNVSGHPALSICNGFTDDRLPLGMQIAGRRFDEATVLRIGAAYERATAWRQTHPACASTDPPRLDTAPEAGTAPPAAEDAAVASALARRLGIENPTLQELGRFSAQFRSIEATARRLPERLPKDIEPLAVFRPEVTP